MNQIFLTIFLLALLFFSACTSSPVHVRRAHEVMSRFTQQVCKDKGLGIMGSGGALVDDVKEISLEFVSNKHLNLIEARISLINITESFLQQINSNQSIIPYLHDYPFTSRNIEFGIIFFKDEEIFAPPPYIACISTIPTKNTVVYWHYDECTGHLKTIHTESYEEALQIYHETLRYSSMN